MAPSRPAVAQPPAAQLPHGRGSFTERVQVYPLPLHLPPPWRPRGDNRLSPLERGQGTKPSPAPRSGNREQQGCEGLHAALPRVGLAGLTPRLILARAGSGPRGSLAGDPEGGSRAGQDPAVPQRLRHRLFPDSLYFCPLVDKRQLPRPKLQPVCLPTFPLLRRIFLGGVILGEAS